MGKLAIFYSDKYHKDKPKIARYKSLPGAFEKYFGSIQVNDWKNATNQVDIILTSTPLTSLNYTPTNSAKDGAREVLSNQTNAIPKKNKFLIISYDTTNYIIEEFDISQPGIYSGIVNTYSINFKSGMYRVFYVDDNDNLDTKTDNTFAKTEHQGKTKSNSSLAFKGSITPKQHNPPFEEFVKNNLHKTKKNIIIYGPPGTGKTYSTKELSLKIKGVVYTNDVDKNDKFNKSLKQNSIVFTTFHQSVSYEEFIEGIKPVVDGGNITYKVQDGLFKKISYAALSQQLGITEIGSLNVQNDIINKIFSLDAKDISRYELLKKVVIQQIDGINDHSNLKELYDKCIEDRVSEATKDETEIEVVKDKSIKENKSVIIIDEINRGNISQIFGELITLIDDDKRYLETNEIRVVLPYSGEVFVVPNNLWIIGTMNTADRSAEALDTALRRRFIFIEMLVNYNAINIIFGANNSTYNVGDLLKTINDRIYILKGKDFEIGHSYFMGLPTQTNSKAINDILIYNILPLLQEYFYNDFEKIAHILSEDYAYNKFSRGERDVNDFFMGQDQDYYAGLPEYIETNAPSENNIEEAIDRIITGR